MKNNVKNKIIAIYENLPSGGARSLFDSNILSLKDKFQLLIISDKRESVKINNIFSYLIYVYHKNPIISKIFNRKISNTNLLLTYHSWVTKSSILLRQRKIPEIYICHEAPREFYDKEYIANFTFKDKLANLVRLGIKKIDKKNVLANKNLTIIANSKFSAKTIYEIYGIKPRIIYPGINLAKFGKYQPIDKRNDQILCVGSVNKLKNQKYILELISKIDKTKKPKVVIIGNGGDSRYINEMYKYAKKNDIDLVIKKNISDKEVVREYKKSKIFCYAPINEPFGIVLIEAMRSGLPIIVSDVGGGYNEVVSPLNGLILSPNNELEWSVAIEKLLGDKKLWKKYSQYNYRYAAKFSDNIMNNKLIKIIQQSLNHP